MGAAYTFTAGDTGVTVFFRMYQNDGSLAFNVAFDDPDLIIRYIRPDDSVVTITPAELTAVDDPWESNGFIHIGQGLYRLDLPNAAVASGAKSICVYHGNGANRKFEEVHISLATSPDAPTAEEIADEVRTELNTELGRIDAAITTRATPAQVNTECDTALADVGVTSIVTGRIDATISTRATPAQVNTALSDAGVTSTRMGYVDNLNIGGNVASSAEATAIQNNTRVVRVVPETIIRPASSTQTFRIELFLYDETGNMEAPDSAPTIALVNQSGTDRSSRLDSTTMALVETGRYRAIYTSTAGDTKEQLVWAFTVVEGGNTRKYGNTSWIDDAFSETFNSADRTKLDAVHGKLPSASYLTGTGNADGSISAVGSITTVSNIVNGGAINTSSGAVSNVTTVGSVTTKTGYALASTGLDLVTAWTTNITGNLSGSVGSVTGNVGGNVVGSVGSIASVTNIVSNTPITTSGGGVSFVGSVTGDINGKVLGGGSGTITGVGAWALDGSGAALATAASLATLQTTCTNIAAVTTKLDTMLVLDGVVYQFTANALELVDSVIGVGDADQATLLLVKAQTDKITTSQLNVVSAFARYGITLKQGDSYIYANGTGATLTIPKPDGSSRYPSSLSGWTVTLRAQSHPDNTASGTGTLNEVLTVTSPTTTQDLHITSLTTTETAALKVGLWLFDIIAVSGSDTRTLISGTMKVDEAQA